MQIHRVTSLSVLNQLTQLTHGNQINPAQYADGIFLIQQYEAKQNAILSKIHQQSMF